MKRVANGFPSIRDASKMSSSPAGNPPHSMDFFEKAYHGKPPWDIGRAQREFVRLEESGRISGDVLDVGCGTGENALYLAGRGHDVWGVDSVPAAIGIARRKAEERGLAATFLVKDTRHLHEIGRTFDTVIDSGLFHTLSDPDRPVFVWNLSRVLKPRGTYFMLAFSELEPAGYGPRRITKQEIQAAFSDGWRITEIRAAVFESHTRPEGSRAWLSSITRI
jgi:2-polyprenyl-3-methyl-5-hydroxy-6-metoxy-1,4-benzoquinol methylase